MLITKHCCKQQKRACNQLITSPFKINKNELILQ